MFDRKSFKATLTRLGYPEGTRFTTKRVSFQDLARADAVFVTIEARIQPETFDELRAGARAAGGIINA